MPDILIERIVPWTVNGIPQPPFLCTPEHLDELAAGHLLAQGSLSQIGNVLHTETLPADESAGCAAQLALVCRGYSPPRDMLSRLQTLAPLQSSLTVSRNALTEMCMRLLGDEAYFGVHRLMLAHRGSEVFREDAGRHNAADKLIGFAAHSGWDFAQTVLGATGRISLEMLAKAAQVGIPVFFSRKYPSDIAVLWAEQLNIALVSRAHSEKMEVFGAAWRIV